MAKKTNDLSHTKWMCKYHIVFTPKYRRKIIYNQYKADIRDIIKQLCSYKGVEIIEGHLMPDHCIFLCDEIALPEIWKSDVRKWKSSMRVYSRSVLSRPYTSRMDLSCSASILVMLI